MKGITSQKQHCHNKRVIKLFQRQNHKQKIDVLWLFTFLFEASDLKFESYDYSS